MLRDVKLEGLSEQMILYFMRCHELCVWLRTWASNSVQCCGVAANIQAHDYVTEAPMVRYTQCFKLQIRVCSSGFRLPFRDMSWMSAQSVTGS